MDEAEDREEDHRDLARTDGARGGLVWRPPGIACSGGHGRLGRYRAPARCTDRGTGTTNRVRTGSGAHRVQEIFYQLSFTARVLMLVCDRVEDRLHNGEAHRSADPLGLGRRIRHWERPPSRLRAGRRSVRQRWAGWCSLGIQKPCECPLLHPYHRLSHRVTHTHTVCVASGCVCRSRNKNIMNTYHTRTHRAS